MAAMNARKMVGVPGVAEDWRWLERTVRAVLTGDLPLSTLQSALATGEAEDSEARDEWVKYRAALSVPAVPKEKDHA